jgi:CheY-like chemotaxis protein
VRIELSAPTGPLLVIIDPSQFDQLLINLAVNARDAMPDGGALQLTLDVVRAGEDGRAIVPDDAGDQVRLLVQDTGSGIAPEVLPHIFEPFFTTKDVGSGTGLGLATVHSLIEQAGGTIDVQSEPGLGTSFTVLLPLAAAPDGDIEQGRYHAKPSSSLRDTTVLVVEDEPALRHLVTRILEEAGYRVLSAASGEEALAKWRVDGPHVSLVLTDIAMVGLGGVRLVDELRTTRPATPVLLMTAYADKEAARRETLPGGRPISSRRCAVQFRRRHAPRRRT